MPYVSAERCNGCGACMDVCPTGAVRLKDNKAVIAQDLCRECGACIEACPVEAISWEPVEAKQQSVLPIVQPSPEIIRVQRPTPMPKRRWLPVLGTTLAFVGREIMPRALDWFLDTWDRRQATSRKVNGVSAPGKMTTTPQSGMSASSGRRRRRRHGRR